MANITHILVATDLTERARPALERALQLKDQSGASLTLLHVVGPGLPSEVTENRREEAMQRLQSQFADMCKRELRRLSFEIVAGEPSSAIIEQAEVRGADLIVLGDATKRRWKDLFVGTTVERIVRLSSQPVLMVSQPGDQPYKRVLVAFDFSPGAGRAVEVALAIAPEADRQVVHAWKAPITAEFSGEPSTEESVRTSVERALVQIGTMEHTKLEVKIAEGNPSRVIRDSLKDCRPGLLAMGTHARSAIGTAILGSVARDILAEAPCDVLVARP